MKIVSLNFRGQSAPIADLPLPPRAVPASPPRRRPGLRLCAAGLLAGLLWSLCPSGEAATRYVDVNNAAPAPPYTSWATAATNIQDAVDAAAPGDEIVVTNGVYQTGAREVFGISNRVAVTKPVTVRSVNGPAVTQIVGYQVPGRTNGPEAVRCVYLTDGAVLAGFTLTHGATPAPGESNGQPFGGGVFCDSASAVVTNCVLTGNSAGYAGGGAARGTLNHCTLSGNTADQGGGAYESTLINCTLSGNSAVLGGGAYWGTLICCTLSGNTALQGGGAHAATLNNCALTGNSADSGGGTSEGTLIHCTLTDNSASSHGGGAYRGTLNQCALTGNSASYGGGASGGTLNNCTLTGNSADEGGGAYGNWDNSCTLNNCALTGNSADKGGGAHDATLNNCTLTDNSAFSHGGGAIGGTLNNCIVYYNRARISGLNYFGGTLNYCCATPLAAGAGNLDVEPQLASAWRLSAGSPCLGRGSATSASGVDLDGEPWANPPSIGCDEYWSGSVTGALSVAVMAAYTNVAVGSAVDFQAVIGGRVSASRWDFGDGMVVSNRPWAAHGWAVAGDYVVELRAYNETYPGGVAATVTVRVLDHPVHYVALTSTNPVPPYSTWATAATSIQDAVDAAGPGALVWVSDGVYQTGARAVYGMSNRVAVTKPMTVRSVNGPTATHITGYQVPGATNGPAAVRCVYLTNGAVLVGFTLTNGATQAAGDSYGNRSGGGVWCEGPGAVVSNCVLTGNSARHGGGGAYDGTLNHCALSGNTADQGGGAFASTLNNCTLAGNSADAGGGAYEGTLNNCTLTGNSAFTGGGAYEATLNNCIVYYNRARENGPNYFASTLSYCCTTPLPASGTGNLAEEPQLASTSHLSPGSPCRGAGSAAYAQGLDIDGEPWGNPPAIGCDEYWSGSVTGALSVAVVAAYTYVAVRSAVDFQAVIGGRVSASRWDFGGGVVVSNRPWATNAWAVTGDYVVELRAYNETYPAGVAATVTVRVVDPQVHYVALTSTNPVPPYDSWATAATNIQDAVDAATRPGALVWVNDGVYQTGARAVYWGTSIYGGTSNRVAVTKPVTVRSVNGPVVTVIDGSAAVRCVYLTNGAVLAGFTLTNGAARLTPYNWINHESYDYLNNSGGGVWCEGPSAVVSNCVVTGNSASDSGGGAYQGTLHNCTLTGNSASSSFLDEDRMAIWPRHTSGGGAAGSTLNHCTLTGNSSYSGGGAAGGTLNNCRLTGNSAQHGGGAASGTLNNCTLTGNRAFPIHRDPWAYGGGAYHCTLNNCTLMGNFVNSEAIPAGGGAYGGTLNNCIAFYNTAWAPPYEGNSEDNYSASSLNHCCTTPLPASGTGNLTNAPLFVDTNDWSDLRLQAISPCINAGNNAYAPGPTDLDGNPRIVRGTVDIGAYEFQGPGSVISYAWLQGYGLPTDGTADFADPDADGHTTWQEWRCQTDPTNALSVLRLLSATRAGTNVTVTWQSVPGVRYSLARSTNLSATPPFTLLATNLTGQPGVMSFTDTNTALALRLFYRVGVP